MFVAAGGLSYGVTQKKNATKRPATPAAKSTAAKSTASHSRATASKAKPTSRAVASRTRKGSTKSSSRTRTAAARRSMQQQPTPDRYREIQQSLSDKGYYNGEVNGAWGADSVSALKRFQQDQKIDPSGKLDSVSIISLGLGPKRNLTAHSTTESKPKDDDRRPEGSQRP
jgi:hypothetical protein